MTIFCPLLADSFTIASYAFCSLFLISNSGSDMTFAIVSLGFVTGSDALLSFVNVSTPAPPPGFAFS